MSNPYYPNQQGVPGLPPSILPPQNRFPPQSSPAVINFALLGPVVAQGPAATQGQGYSPTNISVPYPGPPVQGQLFYPSTSYVTQTDCMACRQRGQGSKIGIPTVRPVFPFAPCGDAEILRKAMKGWGTDEETLIRILTGRTNAQRQEIAVAFKTLYGRDLVADLISETSGRFRDSLVALMTPLYEFLAEELYNAMYGIGTNEATIIDIICSADNAEINAIRQAYWKMKCARDKVGFFAERLHDSMAGAGTNDRSLIRIIVSRSEIDLHDIKNAYRYNDRLETAVEDDTSGDYRKCLIALVSP